MSTQSRSSTWALEGLQSKSESPTQIGNGYREMIFEAKGSGAVSSEEDHGYFSGFDDSMMSSIVTERRRSISELQMASSAEDPERPHDGSSSRRSSFLQAIFKGHPVKPKHKDLGDWRPVPTTLSLTRADAKSTASSRASSSDDHRPDLSRFSGGSCTCRCAQVQPTSFKGRPDKVAEPACPSRNLG